MVVGDVGLDLERTPFYEKELTLRFARSYGPGRYDRTYEEWGVDYPIGHVRWTEGRNLEAVLDLVATAKVQCDDLVTHEFPVDQAATPTRCSSRTSPTSASSSPTRTASARTRRVVALAPRRVGGERRRSARRRKLRPHDPRPGP